MSREQIRAPPLREIFIVEPVVASVNWRDLRPFTIGVKMGGAGGFTCMSEDATGAVEDWLQTYDSMRDAQSLQMIQEVRMIAQAQALIAAGVMTAPFDATIIYQTLMEVDRASLRLKTLMMGANP